MRETSTEGEQTRLWTYRRPVVSWRGRWRPGTISCGIWKALELSPGCSGQEIELPLRKMNLSNNYISDLEESPREVYMYYMNPFKIRNSVLQLKEISKKKDLQGEVISFIRQIYIHLEMEKNGKTFKHIPLQVFSREDGMPRSLFISTSYVNWSSNQ